MKALLLVALLPAGVSAPAAVGPPSSAESADMKAASGAVEAPRGRHDTAWASAEIHRLDGSGEGGGAAAGWLRPGARGHFGLGLSGFELAGTRWFVATGNASRTLGDRWRLDGDLRVGPGERDGSRFTYRMATIGVARELVRRRLSVDLRSQYFDVDPSDGNLLHAGLSYRFDRRLTTRIGYSTSVSGAEETRLRQARVDLNGPRRGVILGFATGQATRALLGPLPEPGRFESSLRHVFAGVRLPVGSRSVQILVDRYRGDTFRRTSLQLLYRWSAAPGGAQR